MSLAYRSWSLHLCRREEETSPQKKEWIFGPKPGGGWTIKFESREQSYLKRILIFLWMDARSNGSLARWAHAGQMAFRSTQFNLWYPRYLETPHKNDGVSHMRHRLRGDHFSIEAEDLRILFSNNDMLRLSVVCFLLP